MSEELFNRFLNVLTDRSRDELRISQELADQNKYRDAHDHQIAASALHDAILLGNEMLASGSKPAPDFLEGAYARAAEKIEREAEMGCDMASRVIESRLSEESLSGQGT